MPPELWKVVDHYAASIHHDRSSWIRMLVTEALAKANALPGDPIAGELARLKELIATRGVEAVRAKLDELVDESVATEKVA